MITATLYSDPACPWAYSESPALRVIEWRYGDQLDWKLVLIGLTEESSQYAARGYTPLRGATGCRSLPSPSPA
jgi:predicted DsbA family dithiol-disulfide isomerase